MLLLFPWSEPSAIHEQRNEDEDNCNPCEGGVVSGDANREECQAEDQENACWCASVWFHRNSISLFQRLDLCVSFGVVKQGGWFTFQRRIEERSQVIIHDNRYALAVDGTLESKLRREWGEQGQI